jgi:hypothetical protein
MRRTLEILLILSFVMAFIGAGARADTDRRSDANDATGPLDIAWIKHSHRTTDAGTHRLVHTIRLYERWPVNRLRHRGFINVFFDLRGNKDGPPERAVYITYDGGKLRAELMDFATDPPRFLRRLPLRRPNGRTVRFTLRKSDLRRRPFSYYRWQAVSFIEEGHRLCGRSGGCDDRAPNRGYLRHNL